MLFAFLHAHDILQVKEIAKPVTSNADLLHIATIASNSITMGKVIAEAYEKIGENGSSVVEGKRRNLCSVCVFFLLRACGRSTKKFWLASIFAVDFSNGRKLN